MIYPQEFENKIGFDTIRQMLKENCLCELGEKLVDKISFLSEFDDINKSLCLLDEFRQILLFSDNFPSQNYFDLTEELSIIKVEGSCIEIEGLFDLKSSLNTINNLLSFFRKASNEDYPNLKKLSSDIFVEKSILNKLDSIINDKGQIRDKASEELHRIRYELIKNQKEIDKKIGQTLVHAKKAGWTDKDVEITIRNGRMVIPVSAASKRKLKGFIHDESSTGQTVFIEPQEIFEANNDIRELINAEKREIYRILLEFTDYLRPHINEIMLSYDFMGMIDFIRAKAKFALNIKAVKPILTHKTFIDWKQAIHPLLFLSFQNQGKNVVPLDIKLDQEKRILVISGPNAGGKSVCLKTIGLLQYMLQCGLLIPLKENSEAGIFNSIFIDIGDEQSIENDLSTYSSHLLNMKFFSGNANKETLFLIDEFGTGTEPILGGAIAEAILEDMNSKGSFGVVTTHYSNLKLLADREEGVFNGAMTFDVKSMYPLFKLKTGRPGSSFTFEIAKNIGLEEEILENASKKTGKTQLDFDKQLQELELEKEVIDKKSTELRVADEFFAEITEKYERLTEDLKKEKNKILEEARIQAKEILDNSNKIIENTIKEIREIQADKEKTRKLRERIKTQQEKISAKLPDNAKKKTLIESTEPTKIDLNEKQMDTLFLPKEGDLVKIKGQNTIGELSEVKGKNAVVISGTMSIRIPLDKLERPSKKDKHSFASVTKKSYGNIISEMNQKLAGFKSHIDVRGKRSDEIISIIRHFIDDAIYLNTKEVSILHGKGDGVLRKIIRDYLAGLPEIKTFQDEHIERGGHGITIVTLR